MESSGPPRGVATMAFSPDASFLVTVDQTRPDIVWIWVLKEVPRLVSALVHEHPVRQVIWHPSKIELLVTTASTAFAAVRYWCPGSDPVITQIPISGEGGRYDAKWVASSQNGPSRFWIGTPEEYVVGYLSRDDGTCFELLNSLSRAH